MNRRTLLQAASGAVLLRVVATLGGGGALAALAACSESKPAFKAVDITGIDYARDFSLPDADGRVRTMADFKGKIVVLFFGYTQCPDVCPTTMAELAEVKKQLGADGDKVQVVFLSLDPERDTPQVLKGYMGNFDPTFIALRPPTPEALAQVAKDFKVYYKKVDGKTPTSYTLDHTASSYVYDTQGRPRLYTTYGAGPASMVSDIQLLLKGA